ncbi:MAG: cytochrome P450 [Planctomycetes bacterium]|nr:cytochrome P450 [Planctomycetota bacterium]
MPAEDWIEVARSDDLVGAGPLAVSARGLDLVLVRSGAELRAFDGVCPHQGTLLGEGELCDGQLVCRTHRWRFDATRGQRDGGPECLARYPVRARDGRIFVDLGARRVAPSAQGRRRWHDLPGPRGVPGFGSALQLGRGQLHARMEQWSEAYGPYCGFKLGSTPVFLISDAELTSRALRARPQVFRRLSKIEAVFRELGVESVFTAEGDGWRRQRRLTMGALSEPNLAGFYPVLRRVLARLLRHWQAKAARGEAFLIQEDLLRFSADVITSLAFGRDVNTIEGGNDVFQDKIATILVALSRRMAAVVPYWRFVSLPRDRALYRALGELREWAATIVAETRASLAQDPGRAPENFLEAMLTATDAEGRPFDEPVILGNALTMLLAGEGLTGNSLAWSVHELCDAPAAVAALRAEVDGVLGGEAFPADFAATKALRYADAVTRETLRLRPVAPFSLLEATRDTALGDLDVRAGEVLICLYRGPATRDEVGPDAGRFSPERWLDEDPEALAKLNAVHMPFGSGPRICPGRSLALLELRAVLSLLYRNFDVERVGAPEEVGETFRFAAVEPEGLRVRLRARAAAPAAPRPA